MSIPATPEKEEQLVASPRSLGVFTRPIPPPTPSVILYAQSALAGAKQTVKHRVDGDVCGVNMWISTPYAGEAEYPVLEETGNTPVTKLKVKYLHQAGIVCLRAHAMVASSHADPFTAAHVSLSCNGAKNQATVTSDTFAMVVIDLATTGLVPGFLYDIEMALWSSGPGYHAMMREIVIVGEISPAATAGVDTKAESRTTSDA